MGNMENPPRPQDIGIARRVYQRGQRDASLHHIERFYPTVEKDRAMVGAAIHGHEQRRVALERKEMLLGRCEEIIDRRAHATAIGGRRRACYRRRGNVLG